MNTLRIEIVLNGEIIDSLSNIQTVKDLRECGFEVKIIEQL